MTFPSRVLLWQRAGLDPEFVDAMNADLVLERVAALEPPWAWALVQPERCDCAACRRVVELVAVVVAGRET